MFSKGKTATKVLENNIILQQYDVGRMFGSGGPEGVWKIYEGLSKVDGRVRLEHFTITQINYYSIIRLVFILFIVNHKAIFEHCRKYQYLCLIKTGEVLQPIIL